MRSAIPHVRLQATTLCVFLGLFSAVSGAQTRDASFLIQQAQAAVQQVPGQMPQTSTGFTPQSASNNSSTHVPQVAHRGMWQFEYKFSRTQKSGLISGTSDINPTAVVNNPNYSRLPVINSVTNVYDCYLPTATPVAGQLPCYVTSIANRMTMNMHTVSAKYHQSNDLSWKVMLNYLSNNIDLYDQTGFTTSNLTTSGIGDAQLLLTNRIAEMDWFDLNFTFGFSMPFGSIDKSYNNNNNTNAQNFGQNSTQNQAIAQYDMQLGSGTYDIITAIAIEGIYHRIEYGAQFNYVNRAGLNEQNYNRGDTIELKGWGRYTLPTGTQIRGGVTQNIFTPYEGRDQRINYNVNYTGGKRLDLQVGAGQKFGDFMVYGDYTYPVKQNLNGVQMKTKSVINLGVQFNYM